VYLHIAEILASGIAHLGLHIAVQSLATATLAVDALSGGIVQVEWTVAAALGQQTLHRAIADLLLDCSQRSFFASGRVRFLALGLGFVFPDNVFIFFG
jgi:hypothetical protein